MKSEERHELKKNDLAEGLTDLPGLWARHGNKVLLVIAAVLLGFTALRYRNNQNVQHEAELRQALANAWSGVDQVTRFAALPASAEMDKMRAAAVNDVNQAVALVTDDASATPTQAAWAWLARGEMYWAVAHADKAAPTTAPTSQAAATQPAEDARGLAATAYNKVVDNYAAVTGPAVIARFGLAALAEEKQDVAAARTQYNAIIETKDAPAFDRQLAVARLGRLDAVAKPLLLLPATRPAAVNSAVDPLSQFGNNPFKLGNAASQPTR